MAVQTEEIAYGLMICNLPSTQGLGFSANSNQWGAVRFNSVHSGDSRSASRCEVLLLLSDEAVSRWSLKDWTCFLAPMLQGNMVQIGSDQIANKRSVRFSASSRLEKKRMQEIASAHQIKVGISRTKQPAASHPNLVLSIIRSGPKI